MLIGRVKKSDSVKASEKKERKIVKMYLRAIEFHFIYGIKAKSVRARIDEKRTWSRKEEESGYLKMRKKE